MPGGLEGERGENAGPNIVKRFSSPDSCDCRCWRCTTSETANRTGGVSRLGEFFSKTSSAHAASIILKTPAGPQVPSKPLVFFWRSQDQRSDGAGARLKWLDSAQTDPGPDTSGLSNFPLGTPQGISSSDRADRSTASRIGKSSSASHRSETVGDIVEILPAWGRVRFGQTNG